jgi:hypothetical protein
MHSTLKLFTWCSCLLIVGLTFSGCSDREAQQKIEFAESTVQRGLEFWQQGGKPAELEAESEPIEFFDDDWNRSAKLVDFEITQTYMESDGTARCAVLLNVKYGKKEPVKVKCTYQIVTDPKVIVARDPMA